MSSFIAIYLRTGNLLYFQQKFSFVRSFNYAHDFPFCGVDYIFITFIFRKSVSDPFFYYRNSFRWACKIQSFNNIRTIFPPLRRGKSFNGVIIEPISYYFCRHTGYNCIRRDIFGHYCTASNNGSVSDCNSLHNYCSCTDPNIITYNCRLKQSRSTMRNICLAPSLSHSGDIILIIHQCMKAIKPLSLIKLKDY